MKRISQLSILTLLILCFGGYAQEKEKPVIEMESVDLGEVEDAFQDHFFEALKQKAIENYEKAIDELVMCLKIDPKPVVYLELGKNYNALQKYSQAAMYLEKGKAIVPANKTILEELYEAYFLAKEFELALPVVRELSVLEPSFSDDLANLYLLNERYDHALYLLDSLDAKRGPSTHRDHVRRQLYTRTNNVSAQIADLKLKIAEDPNNERNYLNLIFVYSDNGLPEEAFEAAKQLLEKHPTSELVHLALYKFYLDEDETEKALFSLEVVLKSSQMDEVTKYQALNDFLLYVYENPDLEEDLIKLVEVFSEGENNKKVYSQLGTFFLEKGKRATALNYFEIAVETGPVDYELYKEVLLLHLEFGNTEEVLALSEKAVEIFPSQPFMYLIRGKTQNMIRDFKAAEETLLMGLAYLIEDPLMESKFYRQLVLASEGLQNTTKAFEYREKAEELEKTTND